MPPNRAAFLANLPGEIVVGIASNLESLANVLAFAHSCKLFRDVFRANVWELAHHVIPRCIECEEEAWTLMSVQENVPVRIAGGYSMTPRTFFRMARNARKVEKAKEWFNNEVMKQIRPGETQWCIEVWGTSKRPPFMTKAEQLRFERAYYLAVTLMEPNGQNLIDRIVLRHLYYVYDMTHLSLPIGEEAWGTEGGTEQRRQLSRDCRARMDELWDRYLPERNLKSRNTLALGPDSFGCFSSHLTMFDHYQSQIRCELLPQQRWSVDISVTQEDLDKYIWGVGKYDDTDT